MKNLLMYSFLLLLSLDGFSQPVPTDSMHAKDRYTIKAKNQQSAAWTLFGFGTGMIGGGVLIAATPSSDYNNEVESALSGIFLITGGIILDLVSIPFFVGASNNRQHAKEVTTSLKLEELPSVVGNSVGQTAVPSLAIQYRF